MIRIVDIGTLESHIKESLDEIAANYVGKKIDDPSDWLRYKSLRTIQWYISNAARMRGDGTFESEADIQARLRQDFPEQVQYLCEMSKGELQAFQETHFDDGRERTEPIKLKRMGGN